MEETPNRKMTTQEIVQEIICEAVTAIDIPIPEVLPPSLTKGQLIKRRIKNLAKHHDQVRANIFAQLPPPSPSDVPTTKEDELADPRLMKALKAPDRPSARPGFAPKRPNDAYSRPLITTQRKPIPSRFRDVIIIMKAIEEYNEFARQSMRSLQEQENSLKESGEIDAPAEMARPVPGVEVRRHSVPLGQSSVFNEGVSSETGDLTMGEAATTTATGGSNVNLNRDPRLRR